ncbi:uncharacterized protein LOC142558060 [Dermacentor variabilis]|uniref:uncharacterized protein LOC142558060 n=1 Tax=Dermacentor variabilis TaxID=34621 RepID=UPI003F5C7128
MKASYAVAAVLLAGCLWANNIDEQQKLLDTLFGGVMYNRFPLKDMYFAVRPDGAPKNSSLYRFNLTNGILINIGHLLKPKYKNETCYAEWKGDLLTASCRFDIKHAAIRYHVKMSVGKPVVQEFTLIALITEFIFGRHRNPCVLTMFVYHRKNCTGNMCDFRQCHITEFMLNSFTIPTFRMFSYQPFKTNASLAEAVYENFEVKLYTEVRLHVMRIINYTCLEELPKRNIT